MNQETASDRSEIIICRVTPWFYRRMGILAAMLVFMGGYFLYDGQFGYRKENAIADEKVKFDGEFLKSFDDARNTGRLDEWIAQTRSRGMPTGENGEPPKWATYAAQHGWPETPKRHGEEEIRQQFEWGGAMLLLAALVIGHVLLTRGKTLTGRADFMVMPGGSEVRFADVFKIDKRKWDHKGLAYVYYRADGVERRAVIDDLKYGGAGKVLGRLLGRFNGELIEKIAEPEPPSHSTTGGTPDAS